MDEFRLLKDQPGVVVAFNISPDVLLSKCDGEESLEVNFRHLFRRLTGRKKSLNTGPVSIIPGSPVPKSKANEAADSGKSMFRSSNTFDSIIDKLERKYYHTTHIDESEGDSMVSDGTDSVSSQLHTPDMEASEKKSKKRKFATDDYDYSDPFIDDTEEVQEYEGVIAAKRSKAQKKGYYVSSGEVVATETSEIVFKPNTSAVLPTKNKTKPPQSKSTTIQKEKDEDAQKDKSAPKAVKNTSAVNAKSGSITTKKVIVEGVNGGATIPESATVEMVIDSPRSAPMPATNLDQGSSNSQSNDALQTEDREAAIDTTTEAKKVRNVVPKAVWAPNPQSISAMDNFKNEVSKFDISSLKKTSPYPTVLELPLLELHKEILVHNDPKELNRTTGYYEFISSCLGSHFPVGRIKTNIARLQAKANCGGMKAQLLGMYQSFCRDLSSAIIPCPEDKKFLKPKDKKEASTSASAATGEEPDSSAEQMLSQLQEPSEEKEPEVLVPTSDGTSPVVAGPETIEFVWYCKWNLHIRQRLVELLDFCVQWANAENDYRGKLVLADKKDMSPDQVRLLLFLK